MLYDYISENIVLNAGNFTKKIERKDHEVYTLFEFRKFRKNLDNYIYKQFFNFIFFYGTRPSETMALRFCDLKRNTVFINHTLHRRGRRELDTPKNQSSLRDLEISYLMRFRIWKLKRIYLKQYSTFKDEYFLFGGEKPLSTSTLDRHKKKEYENAFLL